MEWKLVEGTQEEKPAQVDKISSSTMVYLHRNIKRVEKEDPMSGDTYEVWQYEEAQMTPTEYATYVAENNQANVEYLAMMTDIDLDI